jgi:ribosome-binding factor A
MSHHTEQVASVLRRSIQEIVARGLADPRVRGLTTVTEVKVSGDLADATVLVSVHPPEEEPLTMKGLHSAAGHIRAELLRSLEMRRVPRLHFKVDESLKKQVEVHAAIARAVAQDSESGNNRPNESEPPQPG